MNKTTTIVIIILILGLGIWALARNDDMSMNDDSMNTSLSGSPESETNDTDLNQPTTPADTSTGADVSTGVSTGVTVGAVKSFTIESTNYSFSTTNMTVNKGDKVRITLKNTQGSHDLKVDGYDVKTKLMTSPGEDTIEFTADKSGTFEFYCTYGNHRAMGMKGTLTVK
jgi:plastocyanin